MYLAFRTGRMAKDPATFWYQGEIGFFDNYGEVSQWCSHIDCQFILILTFSHFFVLFFVTRFPQFFPSFPSVIPLAKKLKECGVFGVSSAEFLNYAIQNRAEWEERGQDVVKQLSERLAAQYEASTTVTVSTTQMNSSSYSSSS